MKNNKTETVEKYREGVPIIPEILKMPVVYFFHSFYTQHNQGGGEDNKRCY